MRTTLTLESDAFAAAQAYAQARAIKLGAAVSELIRQAGLSAGQTSRMPALRPMPGAEGLWEFDILSDGVAFASNSMSPARAMAYAHALEQEEDDRSIAFALGVPLDAPPSAVKAALKKAKAGHRATK